MRPAAPPTIIVALDVPELARALALAEQIGAECDYFKVGSELYTAAGPAAVGALRARGASVFLDLKLHDIPNTVLGAAHSAAAAGASLVTVHAAGGVAMVAAAVEGAGAECGVMVVTVLTSLDAAALGTVWGRAVESLEAEVVRLAGVAERGGARGVVCAGTDAGSVRARFGGRLELLVPGIRLPGDATHDQARVVTPAAAAAAGARYLVLGRSVTMASDPAAVLAGVRASLRAGMGGAC